MPLFLIASKLVQRVSKRKVAALLAFALLTLVVGAALFSLTQHMSFGAALYWAITTATTVGYGDIAPHNTVGRVIANVVMLVTIPTIGAVFAIVTGSAVLNNLRRLLGMDSSLPSQPYTVVYGSSSVLSRVVKELASSGDPVVLVAPARPHSMHDDQHFIAGDPSDEQVVRKSHPENANRALVAAETDADTLVIAVHLRALAPELEIYALTQSANVASALSDLGITHTLSSDELVGHTLAKSLEAPQAGDVLLSLLDGSGYRMTQAQVTQNLVGKPLSAARDESGSLVLGLVRGGQVDLGVAADPVLRSGDALITLRAESA